MSYIVAVLDDVSSMRKQHIRGDMDMALDLLVEQLRLIDSDKLLLTTGTGEVLVRTREILYVESGNKVQNIIMTHQTLQVRHTMSFFEERLPAYEFVKIHRCYLVNCRAIKRIDNQDVVLDNGQRLPVSRFRMEHLKEMFKRMYAI